MKTGNYTTFGITTEEFVSGFEHVGTATQLVDACLATDDELAAVSVRGCATAGFDRAGQPCKRDFAHRVVQRRGKRYAVLVHRTDDELREVVHEMKAIEAAQTDVRFQAMLANL